MFSFLRKPFKLDADKIGKSELQDPIGSLKKLLILIFAVIFIRSIHLTIFLHDQKVKLSEDQRYQLFRIRAPRGNIYDRNGRILATNKISYNGYILRVGLKRKQLNRTISTLSRILGLEKEQIMQALIKEPNPAVPVEVVSGLSWDKVVLLQEKSNLLQGFYIEPEPIRYYPFGEFAVHVIGYVSRISRKELEPFSKYGYYMNSIVGKMGIEKEYEDVLRGTDGIKKVEVDARGHLLGMKLEKEAQPGNDIFLSIDFDIQREAEKVMEGKVGALMAMNVKNGEVLAMVSKPEFDPNSFSVAIDPQKWKELLNNPQRPFHNKAIQGLYPASSTFKPVVALSSLEEKVITPEKTFFCPGYTTVGEQTFKCWSVHHRLDLRGAIANSCNVYFINLGLLVGTERIKKWAKKLGLGEKTGIDLPGEVKGLIPDPIWKLRYKKEIWYDGDTANMAIGQGYVLVTLTEMISAYSQIANDGTAYRPHLMKYIDYRNKSDEAFLPSVIRRTKISKETLQFLRKP